MTESQTAWTEETSESFIDTARLFVPERERQVAIIVDRVLGVTGAPRHVVELCPGEGLLTRAFLDADPAVRVTAYDGSETMLAKTRETAGPHADRLTARAFQLETDDWRREESEVCAVVSSLAVHHLDGAGKRALFGDLRAMLRPGGVFVLADLIEPVDPSARAILAAQWEQEVACRSRALLGDESGVTRFRDLNWNLYAPGGEDPMDKPSSLAELFDWMRGAGFERVDLHWCVAGHAILSGVRPTAL